MRLTAPKSTVRVGDIEIRGVQRVLELDALETSITPDAQDRASSYFPHQTSQQPHHPQHNTTAAYTPPQETPPAAATTTTTTQAVPPSALHAIQSRTAIVVPCKDECPQRIAGVWAAIPASSLIVLVSGSSEAAYARERDALADFCRLTGRSGVAVCQRDPVVARAVHAAGMDELLDDGRDGLVYGGKGEGLVLGIALAAAARGPPGATSTASDKNSGRRGAPGYYKYIGFIDADNFVPGSVQEYCRAFSAGLYLAQAEDAMVRISWGSKPKVRDGRLEFKPSGRSSEIVNRWLNSLVRKMDGASSSSSSSSSVVDNAAADEVAVEHERDADNDDIICTGNAGEHAMTISLALKLRLASGYAIEPFHFLDLWERFSGQQSSDKEATGFAGQLPSSPLSMSPAVTPEGCSPVLSASSRDSASATSPSVYSTAGVADVPTCQQLPSPLVVNTAASSIAGADDMTRLATPVSRPGPKIQVLQIRTLNPHFHEDKGEAHVVRMWRQGLSAVYHSPVTAGLAQYREDLRSAILGGGGLTTSSSISRQPPTPPFSSSASDDGIDGSGVRRNSSSSSMSMSGGGGGGEAAVLAAAGWQPERCRVYPPAGCMSLEVFMARLEGGSGGSFWSSGEEEDEQDEEGSCECEGRS